MEAVVKYQLTDVSVRLVTKAPELTLTSLKSNFHGHNTMIFESQWYKSEKLHNREAGIK